MTIKNIMVRALPRDNNGHVPEDLELSPEQTGLIPGIGDRYMGPQFSMDVVRRKFEVTGETMWVFLQDY